MTSSTSSSPSPGLLLSETTAAGAASSQRELLAVRFTNKATDELIELVERRFRAEGLVATSRIRTSSSTRVGDGGGGGDSNRNGSKNGRDGDGDNRVVLTVTATQSALDEEAEEIHLIKYNAAEGVAERFRVSDRSSFRQFASSERILLASRILDQMRVLLPGEKSSDLSDLLVDRFGVQYHQYVRGIDEDSRRRLSATGREKLLLRSGQHSDFLVHVLVENDLVDLVTPLHDPLPRDDILRNTCWPWYRTRPPVDDIFRYYGWTMAYYFAFLSFTTRWLVFPAVLGLCFWLLRWYRDDTVDEDEYTPFYGLIAFLWSVCFVRFWEREECRLSIRFGTYALSDYERQKFFATRSGFTGYLRFSPVTGKPEVYYPQWRRILKYFVSACITGAMLAVAFFVMILSLNLQGYIRPSSNPSRWTDDFPHPFHFAEFAVLSEADRIFDSTSPVRAVLPVIAHVACIFTLNAIYRVIAEALTEWENHETEAAHKSSIILKRFLFESFDCYVALFYLAFYERDVDRLRAELMMVFQVDSLRRVATESVLPLVIARVARSGKRTAPPTRKDVEGAVLNELSREPYEDFDDLMEMIIQLGYVTLFASAYPLASMVSIISLMIEIRNDAFKLSRVCLRPVPRRTSTLGVWSTLLKCIVWMSALTNCLLAGYTSDQLVQYMPKFYIHDRSGYTTFEHDKGWLLVFIIFALEHGLILAGLLINSLVPKIPPDVATELERRNYIQAKRRYRKRVSVTSQAQKVE